MLTLLLFLNTALFSNPPISFDTDYKLLYMKHDHTDKYNCSPEYNYRIWFSKDGKLQGSFEYSEIRGKYKLKENRFKFFYIRIPKGVDPTKEVYSRNEFGYRMGIFIYITRVYMYETSGDTLKLLYNYPGIKGEIKGTFYFLKMKD